MGIDFAFNRIYHEFNQLWINLIVLVAYAIDNIVYTAVTGTPVYPPLTWNSVTSIALGLSVLPLFFLFWLALASINECKFAKLGMDKADEEILGVKVGGG